MASERPDRGGPDGQAKEISAINPHLSLARQKARSRWLPAGELLCRAGRGEERGFNLRQRTGRFVAAQLMFQRTGDMHRAERAELFGVSQ